MGVGGNDSPDRGVTALNIGGMFVDVIVLLRLALSATGGGMEPGVASRDGWRIVAPRNRFFGNGFAWVGVTERLLEAASEVRVLVTGG